MASSFVKMTGVRELGEKLQFLASEVQDKIGRRATNAGAQVIRESAKRRAPVADEDYEVRGITVRAGNLPEKIVVKRVRPTETPLASEHLVVVLAGAKHGYASRVGALQEFGTVKMQAQPFMRPAFDEDGPKAADAIVDTLRTGIDAAVRK
jgi:HK97 gp10 family phage protein